MPAAEKAVRSFEVMAAGDSTVQLLSRHAIREAIYVGRLNAAARVRPAGGKWELIGGYPEFAGIFRMMGGDLAPMAGTRKLAGWRRSGGERTDPLRSVVRERPEPEVPRVPRSAEAAQALPPTPPPDPDREPTTEAIPWSRSEPAPRPVVPPNATPSAPPAPAAKPAPASQSGLTSVLIVVGGLVALGLLAFLILG